MKRNAVKILLILPLLIISVILAALPACSRTGVNPSGEDNITGTKPESSKTQENNSLKLYVDPANSTLLGAAISLFKESNPEIELDITTIDNVDEYSAKISTELMAGEGPDVIVNVSELPFSLKKNDEIGAFADLNELIKDDPGFNTDDYHKAVFDSGLYNGKRYFIPVFFSVNAFLSTEDLLSKFDINIDLQQWTNKEMIEILNELNTQDENERTGGKIYFNNLGKFGINGDWHQFIDFENNKAYLDSPEVIELLKLYKAVEDSKVPKDVLLQFGQNAYKAMQEEMMLFFANSNMLAPCVLYKEASFLKHYLGTEAKLYPAPSGSENNGYTARPIYLAAINQQCRNKELAYKFIKTFLSEELQSSESFYSKIPVNHAVFEKLLTDYSGANAYGSIQPLGTQDNVRLIPISSSLEKDVRYILSNISVCKVMFGSVNAMIWEEINSYLRGDCTAEEAASQMQRKVTLFLNE
ncbi:MAG: ABC transporter substrate-binding protein [Eubacteriales bacterium]|nr:ABC transporter substrate-binding protein [Eubacteriales bacterium]